VPAGPWFSALIADAPKQVSVFHPDDLHMTVAFLGGIDEAQAREAWSLTTNLDADAFSIRLAGLAAMGPARRPSALSVMLDQGKAEAVAIMRALRDDMIAAVGGRPDTRQHLPHITVARPRKKAGSAERHAAVSWAEAKAPLGTTMTLDHLALYTWSNDRQEQKFRLVERLSLP